MRGVAISTAAESRTSPFTERVLAYLADPESWMNDVLGEVVERWVADGQADRDPTVERAQAWLVEHVDSWLKAAVDFGIRTVLLECTSPYRESDVETVRPLVSRSVDAYVPVGLCGTGPPGVCAAGTTDCAAGASLCVRDAVAGPETCNGLDEDGDKRTYGGDPGVGACDTGGDGVCALTWIVDALRKARACGADAAQQWLIDRLQGERPADRRLTQRFVRALQAPVRRQVTAMAKSYGHTEQADIDDLIQEVWVHLLRPSGIARWVAGKRRVVSFVWLLVRRGVANTLRSWRAPTRGGDRAHLGLAAADDMAFLTDEPAWASLARLEHWLARHTDQEQIALYALIDGCSREKARQATSLSRSRVKALAKGLRAFMEFRTLPEEARLFYESVLSGKYRDHASVDTESGPMAWTGVRAFAGAFRRLGDSALGAADRGRSAEGAQTIDLLLEACLEIEHGRRDLISVGRDWSAADIGFDWGQALPLWCRWLAQKSARPDYEARVHAVLEFVSTVPGADGIRSAAWAIAAEQFERPEPVDA